MVGSLLNVPERKAGSWLDRKNHHNSIENCIIELRACPGGTARGSCACTSAVASLKLLESLTTCICGAVSVHPMIFTWLSLYYR